ncbi:MAG: hypothetical protein JRC77_07665, partial [Deltaproteobacteria bacterium]|nr:hypothetical protein [Deltaproteobacteria bacterium]
MQRYLCRLALTISLLILPSCASNSPSESEKTPEEIAAQAAAEDKFNDLMMVHFGHSEGVMLHACWDIYVPDPQDPDFIKVLECYRDQGGEIDEIDVKGTIKARKAKEALSQE